jgi:hypothetical protein
MVDVPNFQEMLERLRKYIAGEWVKSKATDKDEKCD